MIETARKQRGQPPGELEGAVDHDALRNEFVEAGVWIRPFGNVVYLMPALNIPLEELDVLIGAVCEVVARRGQSLTNR